MGKFLSLILLLGFPFFTHVPTASFGDSWVIQTRSQEQILVQKTMDLSTRHKVPSVNTVFSDNILLNLHYLKGDAESVRDNKGKIDWEKVRKPFAFSLTLEPGQTFAYHRNLLPEFKNKDVLVGQSRFWSDEGYKSDGYLVGDGICHLASLFNWAASEAGLKVQAKVNHDFLPVPEIPRQYGTSIFYSPTGARNSANQNLYITNNFSVPVTFNISADGEKVEIQVTAGESATGGHHDFPLVFPA